MRDAEFRAWLEARRWNGKPLSSISSRMSKARKFERAMPALGLGDADLDAAFDADGMHVVTERLRDWCRQAARTGAAPVELVGQTTSAAMRISNVASAVRNYRQFREGANTPVSSWPALDELRAAFLDRVPEFERFDLPDNVYERVERNYKDALIAKVREIAHSDDADEQAGRRIYRALIPSEGALLSWQVEDDFTRKFAELAPAFFAEIGRLARSTEPTVEAIMAAAAGFEGLFARGATSLTLGQVSRITLTVRGVVSPGEAAPFAITKAQQLARLLTGDPNFAGSTLTRAMVERWLELLRRIEAVMRDEWGWAPRDLIDVQGFAWTALDERWGDEGETDVEKTDTPIWLVTARNGEDDGVAHYREGGEWHLLENRGGRMNALVREMRPGDRIVMRDFFGQKHGLPFDARGRRITAMRIRGTGTVTEQRDDGMSVGVDWDAPTEPRVWYFYTNNDPVWRLRLDEEMAQMLAAFIFDGAVQDYDWFVARWFENQQEQTSESLMPDPTNLILYGPPGTGKTYATAEHAVRLCGAGVDSLDRDALMPRYRQLMDEGRITFVTFHQSFSYDEFVEGLRPEAGTAGGLTLTVHDGVFKEMASRAAGFLPASISDEAVAEGAEPRIFRMSIGDAGIAADEKYFQEALTHSEVLLSYNDIDWSDDRYRNRAAILATCNERDHSRTHSLATGDVKGMDDFRNDLQIGDLVVVNRGRSLFRAIGRVRGEYRYVSRPTGKYCHRRAVEWLWHDVQGLPASTIYATGFGIGGIEPLVTSKIRYDAIRQLIGGEERSAPADPLPHVLVIDEINRANISKVFGELITLLEADKRIGAANELRVRLPYSGDPFGVPANLHIVGTMNTADRSIALLDTALRRRFTFEELMPDPNLLKTVDGIDLPALLATLNDRIEYLFDREHQIGHAYFMGCTSADDVHDVMRHKVIPLLQEYFYEDWTKVAAVLGDVFADDGQRREGGFLIRTPLASPFGSDEDADGLGGRTRYRWTVRAPADFSYAKLAG